MNSKVSFYFYKVNDKFFYYDFYTFVEYLAKTQDFEIHVQGK